MMKLDESRMIIKTAPCPYCVTYTADASPLKSVSNTNPIRVACDQRLLIWPSYLLNTINALDMSPHKYGVNPERTRISVYIFSALESKLPARVSSIYNVLRVGYSWFILTIKSSSFEHRVFATLVEEYQITGNARIPHESL
jgi:hypothetical protein